MSKIAVFGMPSKGHFFTVLPLIKRMAAEGDQITFFSTEEFRPLVGKEIQFRPYPNDFHSEPLTQVAIPGKANYLGKQRVYCVLDQLMPVVRELNPDLILLDSFAHWGMGIAEKLGKPAICTIPTFAYNHIREAIHWRPAPVKAGLLKWLHDYYESKARKVAQNIETKFGLNAEQLQKTTQRAGLNLVFTSRLYQPEAERFDERFKFVGPIQVERSERELPGELFTKKPLVYISMGTLIKISWRFFEESIQALKNLDAQIIISAGGRVLKKKIINLPENIKFMDWAPQLQVLRHADVFVNQGGMNSVSESLYFGVPVITVAGQMNDHKFVARRVEELGAGIHLPRRDYNHQTLERAVRKILRDDLFKQNAVRISESFREAGGVDKAVEEIRLLKRVHNLA